MRDYALICVSLFCISVIRALAQVAVQPARANVGSVAWVWEGERAFCVLLL